ncbi:hypothetical protein IFO70_35365 [Phormidium tenue FACHB-886]|nr:hypothetical protein [Phormidium tenue FACHB-886]
MALISVVCPHCQSDESVVKNGKSAEGKQGNSDICAVVRFLRDKLLFCIPLIRDG